MVQRDDMKGLYLSEICSYSLLEFHIEIFAPLFLVHFTKQ